MEVVHKAPVVRSFVTEAQGSAYIKKDDLVLIVLPEEWEIHGACPMSGRMGYVVSVSDSMDVLIKLKKKRGEPEEFVTIPKFCLCLEEVVLNLRKDEKKKQKKELRRCVSDSSYEPDILSSGGSSPSLKRFSAYMLSAR